LEKSYFNSVPVMIVPEGKKPHKTIPKKVKILTNKTHGDDKILREQEVNPETGQYENRVLL